MRVKIVTRSAPRVRLIFVRERYEIVYNAAYRTRGPGAEPRPPEAGSPLGVPQEFPTGEENLPQMESLDTIHGGVV